ncbi:MAG: electron transporter RnfE [Desulfuromonas sp.]|nr:MAG: electron transporter RnfE [Desulfuromonas sp.]
MHMNSFGNWFCGPNGFFSGFHFGGFMPFLFWGIVLFFLYKISQGVVSKNRDNNLNMGRPDSAISVLEKRYASGEIDQDEFLQRKKDLNG